MNRILLVLAGALALPLPAQPATITPEDILSVASISTPRISPDGKRVAYVLTRADMTRSTYDSDLRLADVDGSRDMALTRNPKNDTDPRWSPDGRQIAFLSDREGAPQIYLIDPTGGEATKLSAEKGAIEEFAWSPDGAAIAFLMRDAAGASEEKRREEKDDAHVVGDDLHRKHLYVIDVASHAVRRMTSGDFSVLSVSWSPDGGMLAFDEATGSSLDSEYRTDLFTVPRSGGEPRALLVRPGTDRFPRFSPDGTKIAFLTAGGKFDWLTENDLAVLPVAHPSPDRIDAAGPPRTVSGAYDRSVENFTWSPDSRNLYFSGAWNTTSQLFEVGADGSGFQNLTRSEGLVTEVDVDPRHGVMTAVLQSPSTPPELVVSPIDRFAPRALTAHNASLRQRELGATRLIHWKNPKDGLEIEGLLTLPIGYRDGTRVPLVTFVHGGPASRFDQGFVGYLGVLYPVQSFAARGLAILRPNPRGTGGYGVGFRAGNRADWGGMDWVDINAGIDKVIADGIADPSKLGLMGWSYGGFMATWAEGHSDRLKAISIGAPVVDLFSFHGTTDIVDFIPSYFGGTANQLADLYRAHSPLWSLKKSSTPVLIQHGEADDRVPISQGYMLYRALKDLGVPVVMVTYPRSGHVPREPKLRLDVMRRNLWWFDRWLNGVEKTYEESRHPEER